MQQEAILKAQEEACRFLRAVLPAIAAYQGGDSVYRSWAIKGAKHTTALKRASMDLTRALAEMRRP